jgi:thiol-disulfide isomerase/thioredoxin
MAVEYTRSIEQSKYLTGNRQYICMTEDLYLWKPMKYVILILLLLVTGASVNAQQGHDISVQMKPYSNQYLYLGYYYGKVRALADSVMLDGDARGHFKGKDTLPGGIYFLVSPSKQILFELLIDKDQRFGITADTTNLPFTVKFEGSPENDEFQNYSIFAGTTGKKIFGLNNGYGNAKTKKDSLIIAGQVKLLTGKLQHYRDSSIKKNPGSFLTILFNAMGEPKIPAAKDQPGGKYDSNFVYHFYKDHYWDGISFDDDRLVRTPFFEPKLEKYLQDVVAPNPDSLIKETDQMLLESRVAPEMYRYLMVAFVQRFVNPRYMGQDAVFVHLFEKYINTGKAEFFSTQYKDFTTKRAYSLMANLIGQPAPVLDLTDTAGRALPLYGLKGRFVVVCFWDPTCSHCKEVVPKVDSIYKAKWKGEGVNIYAVKVDGPRPDWIQFIHDHDLTGWSHVYQEQSAQEREEKEGRPGFRQLYDVYQTPLLYLLDKDKRIIAKKLSYLQIDEVIDLKLQSKKSQ